MHSKKPSPKKQAFNDSYDKKGQGKVERQTSGGNWKENAGKNPRCKHVLGNLGDVRWSRTGKGNNRTVPQGNPDARWRRQIIPGTFGFRDQMLPWYFLSLWLPENKANTMQCKIRAVRIFLMPQWNFHRDHNEQSK